MMTVCNDIISPWQILQEIPWLMLWSGLNIWSTFKWLNFKHISVISYCKISGPILLHCWICKTTLCMKSHSFPHNTIITDGLRAPLPNVKDGSCSNYSTFNEIKCNSVLYHNLSKDLTINEALLNVKKDKKKRIWTSIWNVRSSRLINMVNNKFIWLYLLRPLTLPQ